MAGSSPSPSPQASAGPSDVGTQQYLDQLAQLAGGGSSSGTDLYGVGQWKNQPIDVSGFPPAFQAALINAGVRLDTSQKITGAQLAEALSKVHDPGTVAQIQQMLFYAGAYGPSVKSMSDLQVGIFGPKDITALGNTIAVAGQTGTPFGTYLTTSANYGKANGILGQITGATSNPVPQYARAQTDVILRSQAHTLFGHDPSPDEYARFQAFYNQKLIGEANDKAAAANPTAPPGLPDAYTFGQAIGDQANGVPTSGGVLQGGQQALLARAGDSEAGGATGPAFQSQVGRDQSTFGAVTSAASTIDNQGISTYNVAPDPTAAADEFLRQDNPGAIGQNNVATKYATLLSILGGSGS